MANKIKLTVGGMDYYIVSSEDEAYVQSLGHEVNRHLEELMRKNNFLSTTMASVLTALDFCDDAKKTARNIDSLKEQVKSATEDAANARMEADEARREIERLNKENQLLRGKLSRQ